MFFSSAQVGISLQENYLVLVEVMNAHDGLRSIHSINAVEIPPQVFEQGRISNKDLFRNILQEAFKKAHPTPFKTKDIVFEIPEDLSFQQSFDLRADLPEEEVESTILSEAEKMLPFRLDQVSWDYKIVGMQKGMQKVLFVAVPLELVQEYYDFFLSTNLLPMGFSTRIQNVLLTVTDGNTVPTVLLDMQNKQSTLLLFKGSSLIRLDQINIGESHFKKSIMEHYDFTEKNYEDRIKKLSYVDINLATVSVMDQIFQALSERVSRYPAEYFKAQKQEEKKEKTLPQKANFIFMGNTIYYFALRAYFKTHPLERLGSIQGNLKSFLTVRVEDPKLLNIFSLHERSPQKSSQVPVSAPVLFEKTVLQKIFPSAIGSAVSNYASGENKVLNLLPPLVRSVALWKQTSPWFYVMITILLLFSIGWLMVFGFSWGSTTAQLRVSKENFIMVERQFLVKKPESIEQRIEEANKEIKFVAEIKAGQTSVAEILENIKKVLPETVLITALEYGHLQDKTLFELKGVAERREEVIESYQALKNMPILEKVLFPASNLDQSFEVRFSIPFSVKKPKSP